MILKEEDKQDEEKAEEDELAGLNAIEPPLTVVPCVWLNRARRGY